METQSRYTLPTETIIPMSTTPTKFGYGAARELGFELNRLNLRKIVLVSDQHLVATGLLSKIEKILADAGIESIPYYNVGVEPTDLSFKEAISFLSGKRGCRR